MRKITAYGAGPLFTRLARAGRFDDIRLLAEYVKARNGVANDNVEAADDMGIDSVIEVRPTPDEMVRAGVEGLRFDAKGRLTAWRQTDADGKPVLDDDGNERWFAPSERYRQPKSERRTPQRAMVMGTAAHAERLMSLRGSVAFPPAWVPDTRYPSVGAVYERIKAAYDKIVRIGIQSAARQFLDFHMVDGGRTLEQAAAGNPQANVTRGKTVVAYGAEFISGRTESNEGASQGSFVGAPDAAEMTMISAIDAKVAPISDVLDMALAGKTAREIAVANGHNGNKGGEEWAVRAIDRAIGELKKHAA